jgi:hypothetical protein
MTAAPTAAHLWILAGALRWHRSHEGRVSEAFPPWWGALSTRGASGRADGGSSCCSFLCRSPSKGVEKHPGCSHGTTESSSTTDRALGHVSTEDKPLLQGSLWHDPLTTDGIRVILIALSDSAVSPLWGELQWQ